MTTEVKQGDVVRVVLEGQVAYCINGGRDFDVKGPDNHCLAVHQAHDAVKAVEVVTPYLLPLEVGMVFAPVDEWALDKLAVGTVISFVGEKELFPKQEPLETHVKLTNNEWLCLKTPVASFLHATRPSSYFRNDAVWKIDYLPPKVETQ